MQKINGIVGKTVKNKGTAVNVVLIIFFIVKAQMKVRASSVSHKRILRLLYVVNEMYCVSLDMLCVYQCFFLNQILITSYCTNYKRILVRNFLKQIPICTNYR